MKPFTHTLLDVFGMDARYVVPLYQRPYVWRKETHWEPLWDDVQLVLESQENDVPHSHFLGAIVLEQQQTAPGDVPEWLVIDGQQRLTTLQLLLAAAADCAAAGDAAKPARLLRRLVRNSEDLTEGEDRFKIWPTNANRPAFQAVMTPGGPQLGAPDDPSNEIQEAYAFFCERVIEWSAEAGPDELGQRFDRLRVALTSLLKVVSINLEPGDNAQVIFETLNARGTPLLAMDLVKNAVFHRAMQEGADTDQLHADVWLPQLGDDYWRTEVRQGRLTRPRAELFLMHWLAMRLGQIIPATELFSVFRSRILDGPAAQPAAQLLVELNRDAATMRALEQEPRGTAAGDLLYWLSVADATTPLPVALLLACHDDVDPAARDRALRALESYIVRRLIAGLGTKSYSQLAARLIQAARQDLTRADEFIVGELQVSDASAFRWPSDEEVRERLVNKPAYGWIKQSRLVALLSEVELEYRRASKVEDVYVLPSKLSLEHILPQHWETHWPLVDASDASAEARNARLDRIGNLTLVSNGLNSSMSNSAWDTKKAALVDNSVLLMNRRLAAEDGWTDEMIDSRSSTLAQQFCAFWPGG